MNNKKTQLLNKKLPMILFGIFIGVAILVIFASIQHRIVYGFFDLKFKRYIIPVFIGGVSGFIISMLIFRLTETIRKLQENEERLELSLDAVNDGIWDINIKDNTQYFSPNFYKLFNLDYRKDNLNLEKIRGLIHPDDSKKAFDIFDDYRSWSSDFFMEEFRVKNISGENIWMFARGKIIRKDADGNPERITGTLTEFSYIKNIEELLIKTNQEITKKNEELQAANQEMEAMNEELLSTNEQIIISERKYRSILDQMQEGLFEIDLDWNVKYLNTSLTNILQLREMEIYGKNLKKFVSSDYIGRLKNYFDNIISNKISDEFINITVITGSAAKKTLELSTILLLDANNKVNGFRCIARDITEKLKIEQELYRKLKIDSLNVFAGGIAHDFNNLLTGILGNISIAKISAAGTETGESLYDAEKAALMARDLTQQLLAFAKGGAPVKKAVSIKNLLTDTASFVLSGSSIKCDYQLDDNIHSAEIDSVQMSQVVQNLIINAMQSMNGKGNILIKAENIIFSEENKQLPFKDGDYIKISIKDTGSGIPSENILKIFDPFFTTKKTGTGLGLSVCYNIVKNHNGHITVESYPGNGTTFNVFIPASTKTLPVEIKKPEILLNATGRVLLVDDNPAILKVGNQILKQMGFNVCLAGSGEEAIHMVRQSLEITLPFDFAIIDLTLTGDFTGVETLAEIRKIFPDFKAVISSGYTNDPVLLDFKNYGFSCFLKKPYTLEELSQCLKSIIS